MERVMNQKLTEKERVEAHSEISIMEIRMPKLRTPAPLGHYNGTTNPVAHLNSIKASMMYAGVSDEVMCRTFPSTLKGDAQLWFTVGSDTKEDPPTIENHATRSSNVMATKIVDVGDEESVQQPSPDGELEDITLKYGEPPKTTRLGVSLNPQLKQGIKITYEPRRAIKSQAVADFVAEIAMPQEEPPQLTQWIVFVGLG
ncbi:TRNA(Ile)-lysidine synthase [Senna tora]|uniref:tRNA(Ile)-lysidine synthase n=1 Tax=Senna tora TaxID=362788 RepID=A0A834STQ8_9FABA|nr:TRNA(Ile)-lysidine synthase [Senna tora]